MKNHLYYTVLGLLVSSLVLQAQQPFRVEGNGLFQGTSSTNLDIFASDLNVNSLMRFGDNSMAKVSMGWNGNQNYFNFSTAGTLGADDLTLSDNGRFGINTAAADHRFLINHNSTSGTGGSAHLMLQENNTGDMARLRFQNLGDEAYWAIRARGVTGNYEMNFYYTDGLNEAQLITIDGDEEKIGIHQPIPEAYLHLKQQFAGLDAMAFTNDNNANKWSFRIGDEDILIYFNGDIRGGFDVSTGNYNNFPPAPALTGSTKMQDAVLDQVMELKVRTASTEKSGHPLIGFNPQQVGKVNQDWIVPSEDGRQLGLDYLQLAILSIKTIQEQQQLIERQRERLTQLKARKAEHALRLAAIESQLEP